MNIKFNRITLDNFFSFEHAEVLLNGQGFVLVNGINQNPDDLAKSNGSGKSSLFDAISWVLTGETTRGTTEVTRIGCNDTCSVEIDFDVDKHNYVIKRTKDPSNLFVTVDGDNKSGKGIRDTSKILSELLPDLTPELVGGVIILGQGLPQRFSNNTPSGRKEVLEKLSKSNFMVEDLKNRIQDRRSELDKELRVIQDNRLTAEAELNMLKGDLANLDEQCLRFGEIDALPNIIDNLKSNEKEIIDNISSTEDQLKDLASKLESLTEEMRKLRDAHEAYLSEASTRKSAELSEITDKISMTSATAASLSKEIKELKSVTDICPTCGQKIPGAHKIDTTEKEAELAKINEQLKSLYAEEKLIKDRHHSEDTEEKNKYEANKKSINYVLTEIGDEIANKETHVKTQNNSLSQVSLNILNLQKELEYIVILKDTHDDKKKELEAKIVDSEQKISYNNMEEESIKSHLDVVNSMYSVITRDFRGYLLTNVIKYINRKAKEYCIDLFETDKIDIALSGNNIDLSYDNKEYCNLSGGEKQKVDIIVQLSLRDMLCTYSNFSSNIIVLDEITDNMDSVGSDKLFNMLSKKLSDIESVFIISHHTGDLDIPYDNEIIVMKGIDKISRIV